MMNLTKAGLASAVGALLGSQPAAAESWRLADFSDYVSTAAYVLAGTCVAGGVMVWREARKIEREKTRAKHEAALRSIQRLKNRNL
ncbi:hypothetical protein FACS1894186_8620 [Alphaproteobacteria bacterium]|nr:hypothetical protein FACS1894186_8620 [Alphaproteobacteria bacterium]